jgi:hypothetical protein
MTWLENVIYKDQEIENERLELTDKNSLYYLSTDLTLRHCTLVVKVPASRLIIKQGRFIDCIFEVKQELKNHDWSHAFLKGCRFTGRLSGCDFGHRFPYTEGREHGGIEDCDFPRRAWMAAASMIVTPAPSSFPGGRASPSWTPSNEPLSYAASSGRSALVASSSRTCTSTPLRRRPSRVTLPPSRNGSRPPRRS